MSELANGFLWDAAGRPDLEILEMHDRLAIFSSRATPPPELLLPPRPRALISQRRPVVSIATAAGITLAIGLGVASHALSPEPEPPFASTVMTPVPAVMLDEREAIVVAPSESVEVEPPATAVAKPKKTTAKPKKKHARGTKEGIRSVVRGRIGDVRRCYQRGLERDPNLEGRVVVQFQIGHKGRVVVAELQSSDLEDDDVGRCIVAAVKRWKFDPPTSGKIVVTYPFVLRPT